jgi:hypothetical protein
MQPKLVTIATFDSPMQAHIARNSLVAAGIVAMISNESIAGNAWHLTGAVGGVQLHVRADDVEAALKILDEQESIELGLTDTPNAEYTDDGDSEFDQEYFEDDNDEDAAKGSSDLSETEADRLARRAFRAALLGVLFPPLQLYSYWLLLLYMFEPSVASKSSRWQVAGAWFTNLTVIAFLIQILTPPLPPKTID